MVENSPEVCAVHCLELVIIRVAAGGVKSKGEREGKKGGRGKKGERVQERKRRELHMHSQTKFIIQFLA